MGRLTEGGRSPELVALDSIVSAVGASDDQAAVFGMVLDTVIETLAVDGGWITLRSADAAGNAPATAVVCSRGISDDDVAAVAGGSLDEGVFGPVVQGREPLVLGGAAARRPGGAPIGAGLHTMLAVPLAAEAGVIGVLALVTRAPRTYSADDISLVAAAGAILAPAADRRASHDETGLANRQQLLVEASETLNRSLDSPSLETIILAEAMRLVSARKSALLLVRGDVLVAAEVRGLSDRFKRLFVVPLESSAWGKAVLSGETVAVEDLGAAATATGGAPDGSEDGAADAPADVNLSGEGGYRSFLSAPLEGHMGTYGALALFYDQARRFAEADRALLRTFAIQAAIALDNRRLIREKEHMAVHDGLTAVYNRSYLQLALERTSRELRRSGGTVSVLFFDLDGMKEVNDTYGHAAGDKLLQNLASLLQESCRESDIVARYGGDEFVVLMPGTDEKGARRVALKIEKAIALHNETAPAPERLSASVGRYTAAGADSEGVLREADRRMYAMKQSRDHR